jgi:hypothetical protein
MVRYSQTMHLYCVEINTNSKWTEASFHFVIEPTNLYKIKHDGPCLHVDTHTLGLI